MYCYGVVVLNLFIIVLCGFVYFLKCVGVCVCGFGTVWMCEAYVILWVGIWWVLLWCGCTELVYNCNVWFCIFL